jgi:hypothetical protein
MNKVEPTKRRRARKRSPEERKQLLEEFERSGLSAVAFTRERGLDYTTFCRWRRGDVRATVPPGFVEVQCGSPSGSADVTIEIDRVGILRISKPEDIELAAALMDRLRKTSPC